MAERRLRISDDLTLPLEFATEGVAVIGKRGSGKSNTEARFVEVLYEAGVPFAVVDPKGDWYGLKSSRDGKAAGLSVPVFGGLYGDFPLDERTGARIADLLVDEMLSAVLDVSQLSKTGGLPTFLTAFCNQLMHRHQLEPHVRMVILEEAHRYIPQSVTGKTAALKEASASLLLEGRAFGLGCWAATQRPARLHKDVLEEVGTAIIHAIGVSATNDKRTIAGWVDHHDISKEIVDSLTVLRPGEAWVLSPQDGLVRRVQMQRRTTFDSAATPKVGQAPRRPSTMADIDQAAITRALEDVISKAKRDDPRELHRRIAELEREVAATPPEQVVETVVERIEVPVLNGEVDRLMTAAELLSETSTRLVEVGNQIQGAATEIVSAVRRVQTAPSAVVARPAVAQPAPVRTPSAVDEPPEAGALSTYARALLDTFARRHPMRLTRAQLSILSGRSARSSAFGPAVVELQRAGLIEGTGDMGLTATGWDAIGGATPEPQSPAETIETWRRALPTNVARMFNVLIDAYPQALTREEIAARTGYSLTSSAFSPALSLLRKSGLADQSDEGLRATQELFR